MKKIIGLFLIISLVFVFVACEKTTEVKKTTEPTAIVTTEPTATPEPTETPEPTATPVPDIDADVDAILYRFGYEGEGIIDSIFDGEELKSYNSTIEFTEEGLLITVEGLADPYVIFTLPADDYSIDVVKYPVLKMIMKNSSKRATGEFYIGFDGEGIAGTDQNYPFKLEATDEWQTIYLDFSVIKPEAELITAFRADIVAGAPVGSTIVLDFIGFFPTKAAAEAYVAPNHR